MEFGGLTFGGHLELGVLTFGGFLESKFFEIWDFGIFGGLFLIDTVVRIFFSSYLSEAQSMLRYALTTKYYCDKSVIWLELGEIMMQFVLINDSSFWRRQESRLS